jgi:hypothetical protein
MVACMRSAYFCAAADGPVRSSGRLSPSLGISHGSAAAVLGTMEIRHAPEPLSLPNRPIWYVVLQARSTLSWCVCRCPEGEPRDALGAPQRIRYWKRVCPIPQKAAKRL